MNSSQRAAVAEYIFYHGREWRKLFAASYDARAGGDRAGKVEGAGQERAAVVVDKCFICAHSRALATSHDKGGQGRRCVHGAMIHGWLLTNCARSSASCKIRCETFHC